MAGTILPFDLGRGFSKLKDIKPFLDTTAVRSYNILRIPTAVVDDETVTIYGDIYEFDIINTTTGVNTAGGQANHASGALTLTVTAHGQSALNLLRIDNEMLRITTVRDANTVYIAANDRAACGTTAAAHADAATIYKSDDATETVGNNHIPVGLVTTLTGAAAATALIGTINDYVATGRLHGGRAAYNAVSGGTGVVVVSATSLGAYTWPTTETMAGANNAWDNTTFISGADPTRSRIVAAQHVATAADVTNGSVIFPIDFAAAPSCVFIQVRTAAGVYKAWDGAVTFSAASAKFGVPILVTIDNSGATDWANTDVINFIFGE